MNISNFDYSTITTIEDLLMVMGVTLNCTATLALRHMDGHPVMDTDEQWEVVADYASEICHVLESFRPDSIPRS